MNNRNNFTSSTLRLLLALVYSFSVAGLFGQNAQAATDVSLKTVYTGSLSATEVYDDAEMVTLTIQTPGGTVPPASNWYDPHGVLLSVGCSVVREFDYSGPLLYQVRDHFCISGHNREPGQYRVLVGSDIDLTFTINAYTGVNNSVYAFEVQTDGKILIYGDFTSLFGQTRTYIGRLNSNWTLDTTFNPNPVGFLRAMTIQSDGNILLGGYFTEIAGETRIRIARLNPDGSLDATFTPVANATVYALVEQTDGKILVGGDFTTLAGESRSRIARLNPNGSIDSEFNPGADGRVGALNLQADGKILVRGDFTTLAGESRSHLARLNPDGTLDDTFNPDVNGDVNALTIQRDGKILIGGIFSSVAGETRNYIARLNPEGTLNAFNPEANNRVRALKQQTDGKILVVGDFTTLAGEPRNYIGRLYSNGVIDPTFDPGANNIIMALALQADGRIVLGGDFTILGGESINRVGRLYPDGSYTIAFNKLAPVNGATNQVLNPTLDWDSMTGASSYEYCIDTTNNNICNTSWISTNLNTFVGLHGLSANTTYCWQVHAVNTGITTEADGGTWRSFTTKALLTVLSTGTSDGWILESSETSSLGGTLNATGPIFNLGDEAGDKQYRAVLSFNTASLPDTAVITKVTLKIKHPATGYLIGNNNPFTWGLGLKVDMRKPFFGTTAALVITDFQAAAGKSAVATFSATPAAYWYSAVLNATGRAYVNKTGTTQFRLRFFKDDNNDNAADYMKFFSGNYVTATARPTLVIEYYVP